MNFFKYRIFQTSSPYHPLPPMVAALRASAQIFASLRRENSTQPSMNERFLLPPNERRFKYVLCGSGVRKMRRMVPWGERRRRRVGGFMNGGIRER